MGIMKKVAVFVVILSLLLLSACGTDIVGNWKAVKVSYEGNDLEYDEYIKSINTDGYKNTDITIRISNDGKYELTIMGDNTTGTWTEKDKTYYLDFSGKEVKAVLEGTILSIPLGNVIFHFKK